MAASDAPILRGIAVGTGALTLEPTLADAAVEDGRISAAPPEIEGTVL